MTTRPMIDTNMRTSYGHVELLPEHLDPHHELEKRMSAVQGKPSKNIRMSQEVASLYVRNRTGLESKNDGTKHSPHGMSNKSFEE